MGARTLTGGWPEKTSVTSVQGSVVAAAALLTGVQASALQCRSRALHHTSRGGRCGFNEPHSRGPASQCLGSRGGVVVGWADRHVIRAHSQRRQGHAGQAAAQTHAAALPAGGRAGGGQPVGKAGAQRGTGRTIKQAWLSRLRRSHRRVGVVRAAHGGQSGRPPIVESVTGHKGVGEAARAHEGPHVGVDCKVRRVAVVVGHGQGESRLDTEGGAGTVQRRLAICQAHYWSIRNHPGVAGRHRIACSLACSPINANLGR